MKLMAGSFTVILTGSALLTSQESVQAKSQASTKLEKLLAPHKASYGYYVDQYLLNRKENDSPDTNPSTALFNNTFAKFYKGDGTKLNPKILQENIDKSVKISENVTPAEELRSYITDRQDSPYDVIRGLGPYAEAFIENSNAKTLFYNLPTSELPADTKDDPGSGITWADEKSKLGSMVDLVDTTALWYYSSSGNAKQFYKYIRPFRQDPRVQVNPYLKAAFDATPQNDYDFPSGHTTQAWETGLSMAYAFPERFQQLVTRSSEVGYDRILVGRHSPLAVMGGRILGTAVAASVLNNSQNKSIANKAYQNAQSVLLHSKVTKSKDDYKNYQTNLKNFEYRMTYGYKPISSTKEKMRVPKGAEVLIQTRFPYLNATQRREVLYTTGFKSGYPMGQDTEGWGRLDLFKAGAGFGSLLGNTTVNMNAKRGGFDASDTWRNNISGSGALIKKGTGSLTLEGANSYKGGTFIKDGTIIAANKDALGSGNLKLSDGTLKLSTKAVSVKGNYTQGKKGTVRVNGNSRIVAKGTGRLGGKLVINLKSKPSKKHVLFKFSSRHGKFAHVTVSGGYKGWHVAYTKNGVELVK
ncbi:autotransporter-associated beta strand repeat protein [Lentilactobacillus kefiri DSM 20587 = JCM 5818]|nr:autotransporter-associated beta strand repeat protein [Lentilactobacillus parakefiri DSM 10551]KRM50071.1 autotransporter-associated beta strand repeat protein [Lentilactobacillus kefiri DSM 20587 = JCM 5818]